MEKYILFIEKEVSYRKQYRFCVICKKEFDDNYRELKIIKAKVLDNTTGVNFNKIKLTRLYVGASYGFYFSHTNAYRTFTSTFITFKRKDTTWKKYLEEFDYYDIYFSDNLEELELIYELQ